MPAEVVAMQNDIEGLDAGLKSITQKIQFMKVNVPLAARVDPARRDRAEQQGPRAGR